LTRSGFKVPPFVSPPSSSSRTAFKRDSVGFCASIKKPQLAAPVLLPLPSLSLSLGLLGLLGTSLVLFGFLIFRTVRSLLSSAHAAASRTESQSLDCIAATVRLTCCRFRGWLARSTSWCQHPSTCSPLSPASPLSLSLSRSLSQPSVTKTDSQVTDLLLTHALLPRPPTSADSPTFQCYTWTPFLCKTPFCFGLSHFVEAFINKSTSSALGAPSTGLVRLTGTRAEAVRLINARLLSVSHSESELIQFAVRSATDPKSTGICRPAESACFPSLPSLSLSLSLQLCFIQSASQTSKLSIVFVTLPHHFVSSFTKKNRFPLTVVIASYPIKLATFLVLLVRRLLRPFIRLSFRYLLPRPEIVAVHRKRRLAPSSRLATDGQLVALSLSFSLGPVSTLQLKPLYSIVFD
jgi:hypothetical protein